MSDQTVQVALPEAIYERVRQIAEASQRPIERVLADSLSLLFGELAETGELTPEQLGQFDDAQLWAIVHRRLAWAYDARLRELTALGKQGRLTADEADELERLVEQVDRYVLLRSQALLLLKQRGYDVERRLKLGA